MESYKHNVNSGLRNKTLASKGLNRRCKSACQPDMSGFAVALSEAVICDVIFQHPILIKQYRVLTCKIDVRLTCKSATSIYSLSDATASQHIACPGDLKRADGVI